MANMERTVQIQKLMEENNIPFWGSGSEAYRMMFHKDQANGKLSELGYNYLEQAAIDTTDISLDAIQHFIGNKKGNFVVKPSSGGSSIGVTVAKNEQDIIQAANTIQEQNLSKNAVLEEYVTGAEFTVVVINTDTGPCAFPSQIIIHSDKENEIFTYRRKYLPTSNTSWHCPAQFCDQTINLIREQAVDLFKQFAMRDFARLDGWIQDGHVIFSDFNPLSGMEQNSFLFQEASRLGINHEHTLKMIIQSACQEIISILKISQNRQYKMISKSG